MKKSIISFIAVILVIGVMAVAAIKGFTIPGGFVTPVNMSAEDAENATVIIPSIHDATNGIRRGLDLVGGSSITFEAVLPDDYDSSHLSSDMNTAQSLLRSRLTAEGYTEANVSIQGDNRLVVEIPNIKNPEDAVQMLGATAKLSFMDMTGKEWLTGSDIRQATAIYGKPSASSVVDEWYVALEFNSDAVQKFYEATTAISQMDDGQNLLAIVLDDQVVSAPAVSEPINSSTCSINGNFTEDSARELANLINVGQLPFSLQQVELRSVGPQLGADALQTSVYAAIIGIALVCIFMIAVYRLPGLVACIALSFYRTLELIILGWLHVNLSLPGIAGIILSIGMAVDANVIIFERVKEELRAGKTVKSAIDSGFKRAFTAIFDSNITTLIAAGVLYFLGTGTIVGFATTLGLGVIISMFTALTLTHFLLNRMVDFKIRNPKVYGA